MAPRSNPRLSHRRRTTAPRDKTSRRKIARRKPAAKKSSHPESSSPKSSREKVRAYRQRMRAKGLRLVQMWLPDARTQEFAAAARRQSALANRSAFAAADHAWADAAVNWKIY